MTSARARRPRGGARFPGTVIRIAGRRKGPARPGYGFAQWDSPVPRPARNGAGPHPTVNDLLVTALILAVHRWNVARSGDGGPGLSRGRISVAVPVNIRDARHRWTGPGNQSRVIRVRARPDESEQPLVLLASVSRQVRTARERPRPGLDGASRALASGWAPAGVKRVAIRLARRLSSPFVTDTALVSNLGILPAPPSFTGADGPRPLWFSGPAPLPRGLGLAALTSGDRLHLTIVYSRALLDAEAAADFAAAYRRALAGLAAITPDDVLSGRETS